MNTAITNTEATIVGAELTFSFPNGVMKKDMETIKKRVQSHCVNSGYTANALFFFDYDTIRVVIGYEIEPYEERTIYDTLRKPLQRLIDSHKEAATFGWSY